MSSDYENLNVPEIDSTPSIRVQIAELVFIANARVLPARRVPLTAALMVAERVLTRSPYDDLTARSFAVERAVEKFLSLATLGPRTGELIEHEDLLPVAHPFSTAVSPLTASAITEARSEWLAADPRIDDELRPLVASAYTLEFGSIERTHALARLEAASGEVPLDLIALVADGNSSAARSARARRQLRDRLKRFAYEGGMGGFLVRIGVKVKDKVGALVGGSSTTGIGEVYITEDDEELGLKKGDILPVKLDNYEGLDVILTDAELEKAGVELPGSEVSSSKRAQDIKELLANKLEAPSDWKKLPNGDFVTEDGFVATPKGNLQYELKDENGNVVPGLEAAEWPDIQKHIKKAAEDEFGTPDESEPEAPTYEKSDLRVDQLFTGDLLPAYYPIKGAEESLLKKRQADPNYELPPTDEIIGVYKSSNPAKRGIKVRDLKTGKERYFEVNRKARIYDVRQKQLAPVKPEPQKQEPEAVTTPEAVTPAPAASPSAFRWPSSRDPEKKTFWNPVDKKFVDNQMETGKSSSTYTHPLYQLPGKAATRVREALQQKITKLKGMDQSDPNVQSELARASKALPFWREQELRSLNGILKEITMDDIDAGIEALSDYAKPGEDSELNAEKNASALAKVQREVGKEVTGKTYTDSSEDPLKYPGWKGMNAEQVTRAQLVTIRDMANKKELSPEQREDILRKANFTLQIGDASSLIKMLSDLPFRKGGQITPGTDPLNKHSDPFLERVKMLVAPYDDDFKLRDAIDFGGATKEDILDVFNGADVLDSDVIKMLRYVDLPKAKELKKEVLDAANNVGTEKATPEVKAAPKNKPSMKQKEMIRSMLLERVMTSEQRQGYMDRLASIDKFEVNSLFNELKALPKAKVPLTDGTDPLNQHVNPGLAKIKQRLAPFDLDGSIRRAIDEKTANGEEVSSSDVRALLKGNSDWEDSAKSYSDYNQAGKSLLIALSTHNTEAEKQAASDNAANSAEAKKALDDKLDAMRQGQANLGVLSKEEHQAKLEELAALISDENDPNGEVRRGILDGTLRTGDDIINALRAQEIKDEYKNMSPTKFATQYKYVSADEAKTPELWEVVNAAYGLPSAPEDFARQFVANSLRGYDNENGDLSKLINSGASANEIFEWLDTNSQAWNTKQADYDTRMYVDKPWPFQKESWKKFGELRQTVFDLDQDQPSDEEQPNVEFISALSEKLPENTISSLDAELPEAFSGDSLSTVLGKIQSEEDLQLAVDEISIARASEGVTPEQEALLQKVQDAAIQKFYEDNPDLENTMAEPANIVVPSPQPEPSAEPETDSEISPLTVSELYESLKDLEELEGGYPLSLYEQVLEVQQGADNADAVREEVADLLAEGNKEGAVKKLSELADAYDYVAEQIELARQLDADAFSDPDFKKKDQDKVIANHKEAASLARELAAAAKVEQQKPTTQTDGNSANQTSTPNWSFDFDLSSPDTLADDLGLPKKEDGYTEHEFLDAWLKKNGLDKKGVKYTPVEDGSTVTDVQFEIPDSAKNAFAKAYIGADSKTFWADVADGNYGVPIEGTPEATVTGGKPENKTDKPEFTGEFTGLREPEFMAEEVGLPSQKADDEDWTEEELMDAWLKFYGLDKLGVKYGKITPSYNGHDVELEIPDAAKDAFAKAYANEDSWDGVDDMVTPIGDSTPSASEAKPNWKFDFDLSDPDYLADIYGLPEKEDGYTANEIVDEWLKKNGLDKAGVKYVPVDENSTASDVLFEIPDSAKDDFAAAYLPGEKEFWDDVANGNYGQPVGEVLGLSESVENPFSTDNSDKLLVEAKTLRQEIEDLDFAIKTMLDTNETGYEPMLKGVTGNDNVVKNLLDSLDESDGANNIAIAGDLYALHDILVNLGTAPLVTENIKDIADAMDAFVPAGGGEKNNVVTVDTIKEEQDGVLDLSTWKKIGGQKGSNPGGTYENPATGEQVYVKTPKSQLHGENERLASALYEAAGISSAKVFKGKLADGTEVTYSPMIDGAKPDLKKNLKNKEYMARLQQGFAIDALLANWDVIGLDYDNVVTDKNGEPVRVDPGGALLFRAQGSPKGGAFGEDVPELDAFTDTTSSRPSAKVFSQMTDEQKLESAKVLQNLSPSQIDELVDSIITDSEKREELKTKLKARREAILGKFELSTKPAKKKNPEAGSSGKTKKLDVTGDTDNLQAQLEEAAKNGDLVSFKYNGKERVVAPTYVWTNPKNGNINLTGNEDGVSKNYTLQNFEASSLDLPADDSVAETPGFDSPLDKEKKIAIATSKKPGDQAVWMEGKTKDGRRGWSYYGEGITVEVTENFDGSFTRRGTDSPEPTFTTDVEKAFALPGSSTSESTSESASDTTDDDFRAEVQEATGDIENLLEKLDSINTFDFDSVDAIDVKNAKINLKNAENSMAKAQESLVAGDIDGARGLVEQASKILVSTADLFENIMGQTDEEKAVRELGKNTRALAVQMRETLLGKEEQKEETSVPEESAPSSDKVSTETLDAIVKAAVKKYDQTVPEHSYDAEGIGNSIESQIDELRADVKSGKDLDAKETAKKMRLLASLYRELADAVTEDEGEDGAEYSMDDSSIQDLIEGAKELEKLADLFSANKTDAPATPAVNEPTPETTIPDLADEKARTEAAQSIQSQLPAGYTASPEKGAGSTGFVMVKNDLGETVAMVTMDPDDTSKYAVQNFKAGWKIESADSLDDATAKLVNATKVVEEPGQVVQLSDGTTGKLGAKVVHSKNGITGTIVGFQKDPNYVKVKPDNGQAIKIMSINQIKSNGSGGEGGEGGEGVTPPTTPDAPSAPEAPKAPKAPKTTFVPQKSESMTLFSGSDGQMSKVTVIKTPEGAWDVLYDFNGPNFKPLHTSLDSREDAEAKALKALSKPDLMADLENPEVALKKKSSTEYTLDTASAYTFDYRNLPNEDSTPVPADVEGFVDVDGFRMGAGEIVKDVATGKIGVIRGPGYGDDPKARVFWNDGSQESVDSNTLKSLGKRITNTNILYNLYQTYSVDFMANSQPLDSPGAKSSWMDTKRTDINGQTLWKKQIVIDKNGDVGVVLGASSTKGYVNVAYPDGTKARSAATLFGQDLRADVEENKIKNAQQFYKSIQTNPNLYGEFPSFGTPGTKSTKVKKPEVQLTFGDFVEGTGTAAVNVAEPLDWDQSAFSDVPPLHQLLQNVADTSSNPDAGIIGGSTAIDAGEVEDLDVRVMRAKLASGELGYFLKYKLTSWAGDDLAAKLSDAVKNGDPSVTYVDGLEIPENLTNNGVLDLTPGLDGAKYKSGWGGTYIVTMDDGTKVQFFRAGKDASTANNGSAPLAFHNLVFITAPDASATPQGLSNALASGGITQVRPSTEADAKVLIENRLISVLGNQVDPTRNVSNQEKRAAILEEIKDKYGITPDNVSLKVGAGGRLEIRLDAASARKLAKKSRIAYITHNLHSAGSRRFKEDNQTDEEHRESIAEWFASRIGSPQGGLLATGTRWTEGINRKGMSSTSDIPTGGADYVFTIPIGETGKKHSTWGSQDWVVQKGTSNDIIPVMYYDPELLFQRLDFWANKQDSYGRRGGLPIPDAKPGSYELMFKSRLGIDDMKVIVVKDQDMRTRLITKLRQKGITEIGGKPLEQMVVTDMKNPTA